MKKFLTSALGAGALVLATVTDAGFATAIPAATVYTQPQQAPSKDTMAPGPVTGVTVTGNTLHSISLEWAVPKDADLTHVLIRRAVGDQPPLSASDGTLVAVLGSHATEFTDQKLDGRTAYSYAVYASDRQRNLSTPSTVSASTLTTNDRTGIRGALTDKQGHPIAGVSVEVNAVDGGYAGEATTGADGSYRVTNIQPGTYTVCFQVTSQTKGSSPTGYFNGCYRQQPFGSGDSGTPVTVTAGKTVNGINDYLAVAGAVSGRITDPSGAGVGNVRVYVASPWYAYHSATSSADGSYTITGLPADSYRVCFDASHATGAVSTGYLDECYDNQPQWNATAIPVRLGHTTRGINAVLAVGGAVTGTVIAPAGNPAAGVIASLRPSDTQDMVITDAQGGYRISGIVPGAYAVCVNGAEVTSTTAPYGYITGCGPDFEVVAGQTVTQHRTVQLAGAIGGSVSGPDGSPVAGVWTTVYDSAGIAIDTMTDESGNWQLAGLDAGQYTVCYDPSFTSGGFRRGCYDGQPHGATTGTPVTVTGGQLTTVNEALVPGATIRGTVSDKDGRPIGLVRVSVIPLAGAGGLNFAFTDDAGSYILAGLDPGSYAVCFDASYAQDPSGLGYSSECYDNQPSADTADPVVLADAGTVRVDAVLANGPAITGRVTDPNGVGVSNVGVVATSTASGQSGYAWTDWDGSYQASTIASGIDAQLKIGGAVTAPPTSPSA